MAIVQDTLTNEDGQTVDIFIEVDDKNIFSEDGRITRGPKEQIIRVQETFTKAMGLIRTCSEQVAATVKTVPEHVRPHGFEVQFAIKVDTSVGAIIAQSSAEAQLQVTLRWEKKD